MKISDIKDMINQKETQPIGKYSYFSVLVPIVNINDSHHLLFEVRSNDLKRQPNEICFPGGKTEKNETYSECAIRETCEELNIKKKQIELLGDLDYIITYSNFTLYPFLGSLNIDKLEDINCNKGEVSNVFTVPIDFFIKNKPLQYDAKTLPKINDDFPFNLIPNGKNYNWRSGQIPIYFYTYEDKVIWGLTARIINNFINNIIIPLNSKY